MRNLNLDSLVVDLKHWIKSYTSTAGMKGLIVGLSGGIDSAVTASLCVQALGENNVVGVSMPCESIRKDLEDAKLMADHLNISFHVIDLTSTFKELIHQIPDEVESNRMARSNIKPRLRMTTLYYLAQSLGYLVAGTGNRSEIAIGYFTKYGDGGVDIEPMGHFYKCEVRTLARLLNVPERIITKPPSAGLWDGQTDEAEIGMYYDELDELLYRLDHSLALEDLDPDKVQKVKEMIKKAEHKNNMPPMFEI